MEQSLLGTGRVVLRNVQLYLIVNTGLGCLHQQVISSSSAFILIIIVITNSPFCLLPEVCLPSGLARSECNFWGEILHRWSLTIPMFQRLKYPNTLNWILMPTLEDWKWSLQILEDPKCYNAQIPQNTVRQTTDYIPCWNTDDIQLKSLIQENMKELLQYCGCSL